MYKFYIHYAILVIVSVILIGSTINLPPLPETPTAQPSTLSETYIITDFGFSIDYPAGWFAGSDDPVSIICELEDDLKQLLIDNTTTSGLLS